MSLHNIPQALIDTTTSILFEKKDHLIKRLRNLTDEQKQEVIDFFRVKPNLENKIDWNRRDLTYDDFLKIMDPKGIKAWSQKRMIKSSGIRGLAEGKDYIALDAPEGIDAYIPLNYEASRSIACSSLGSGSTTWCTARERYHWNQYIEDDNVLIYILYPDTKEAIVYDKYARELVELRNADNDEIGETDIHGKILEKNMKDIIDARISYFDEEEIEDKARELAEEDYYLMLDEPETARPSSKYVLQRNENLLIDYYYYNIIQKSDYSFKDYIDDQIGLDGKVDDALIKGLKDITIAVPVYGWKDKDKYEIWIVDPNEEEVNERNEGLSFLLKTNFLDIDDMIYQGFLFRYKGFYTHFEMTFWDNPIYTKKIEELSSNYVLDLTPEQGEEDEYWIILLKDESIIEDWVEYVRENLLSYDQPEDFWYNYNEIYIEAAEIELRENG